MARVEVIGDATLILGDAYEVLPTLARPDAVIADPVYGVGKKYGESVKDDLPAFQRAVVAVSGIPAPAVVFTPVVRVLDLPVRPQWIGIWRKTYGGLILRHYPFCPHWEALAFYNIKGNYRGNKGQRSDVFDYPPTRARGSGHPTPKPVELMQALALFLPGKMILDPFMGSGTTGVACMNIGKKFIGIEIERRYFDLAYQRILEAWRNRPRLIRPRQARKNTQLEFTADFK